MPTLLLSRKCRPEARRLVEIAHQTQWNHQWLGKDRLPARLPQDGFAYYGVTDTAMRLVDAFQVALIEPTFDLLATLPRSYVCRTIELTTLGKALTISSRVFVIPADCTRRAINAQVWQSGTLIFCDDDLPRTTPVIVSDPVEWEIEYRLVVLDRRVVTFSPYIRRGKLACNDAGA